MVRKKTFFEFFAGGGMARLGLGDGWSCLFANDFDSQKASAYRENFDSEHFHTGDITTLSIDDLPSSAPDLVWSSFPCQDLSLAGARKGLAGSRSGTFHAFWYLMLALKKQKRSPSLLVLENVAGLLTSNCGKDFSSVIDAMSKAGFHVSALVLDAQMFTPQSRKRVFIFGFADNIVPGVSALPDASPETPEALLTAVAALPPKTRSKWRWLTPRPSNLRNTALSDVIDSHRGDWMPAAETKKLIATMSPRQFSALDMLRASGKRHVGAAYKRIRIENGERVLRVEARFDGVAGCLRTPAGGSSRQLVFEIDDGVVRSRLMTPSEAARLMGLPDDYILPSGSTAALKLCGDGVCVPVVRWIAENILEPSLDLNKAAA